jgi:hypothetical protein
MPHERDAYHLGVNMPHERDAYHLGVNMPHERDAYHLGVNMPSKKIHAAPTAEARSGWDLIPGETQYAV